MKGVRFCFDKGAVLKDKQQIEKAFIEAIGTGNIEIIEELEKRGYQFSLANLEERKGLEILINAYKKGGRELLVKVCGYHPSEKIYNEMANSILEVIVRKNDLEVLEFLENKNVKFEEKFLKKAVEDFISGYYKGVDAYMKVIGKLDKKDQKKILEKNIVSIIRQKDLTFIDYAFDNGVNPNMQGEKDWYGNFKNLIFDAIDTNDPKIVKLLIDRKVDLVVKYQDLNPLSYALEKDSPDPEVLTLLGG